MQLNNRYIFHLDVKTQWSTTDRNICPPVLNCIIRLWCLIEAWPLYAMEDRFCKLIATFYLTILTFFYITQNSEFQM